MDFDSGVHASQHERQAAFRRQLGKTAIVAYLKFLLSGHLVGVPMHGHGLGGMPELKRAANPMHGHAVYAKSCATCHGDHGQRHRTGAIGDAPGYVTPPLWGPKQLQRRRGDEPADQCRQLRSQQHAKRCDLAGTRTDDARCVGCSGLHRIAASASQS
jgi:hypothetical protein